MIVEPGQFKYRLDELKEAYDTGVDMRRVASIEFEQVPTIHVDMAYTARLTKDGKGDLKEPLRFVRRRTVVRLLDSKGKVLWSNQSTQEVPVSA